MKLRGDHVVIRKEKGRPVGHDHINGIEGFGSYAKNWLYPYRSVPSKYSHLCLGKVRIASTTANLQTGYTSACAILRSPHSLLFWSRSEGNYQIKRGSQLATPSSSILKLTDSSQTGFPNCLRPHP